MGWLVCLGGGGGTESDTCASGVAFKGLVGDLFVKLGVVVG